MVDSLHPTQAKTEFVRGIYLEHLEEAGALYEQWRTLHGDPEVTWRAIAGFEDRAEAHLDALAVGSEEAASVCAEQAAEGEPGEAYAAVQVFCRQGEQDRVEALLDALDPADTECIGAVGDGLLHALPAAWVPAMTSRLLDGGGTLPVVAARLATYRSVPVGAELLRALPGTDAAHLPKLIQALGRLQEPRARQPLYDTYLRHEEPPVRAATALALLRLGAEQVVQYAAASARAQPELLLPVGWGGSRTHVAPLLQALREHPTPDGLLALGLLGDPAAVEPLLAHLAVPERAEAAAAALELITGAGLTEEVELVEPVDEDELFEDEVGGVDEEEVFEQEEPEAATAPAGVEITRLSQKPEDWQAWWAGNAARFQPQTRYRQGQPTAPAVLLESLRAERTPHLIRRLTAEELAIRYGCPVAFETDMLVAEQDRALDAVEAWAREHEGTFLSGRWYFGGRLYSR